MASCLSLNQLAALVGLAGNQLGSPVGCTISGPLVLLALHVVLMGLLVRLTAILAKKATSRLQTEGNTQWKGMLCFLDY